MPRDFMRALAGIDSELRRRPKAGRQLALRSPGNGTGRLRGCVPDAVTQPLHHRLTRLAANQVMFDLGPLLPAEEVGHVVVQPVFPWMAVHRAGRLRQDAGRSKGPPERFGPAIQSDRRPGFALSRG